MAILAFAASLAGLWDDTPCDVLVMLTIPSMQDNAIIKIKIRASYLHTVIMEWRWLFHSLIL